MRIFLAGVNCHSNISPIRSGSLPSSLPLMSDKDTRQILPHVPEFYTMLLYNHSASHSHYQLKCNGFPAKPVNVFDKYSLLQALCSFLGNCGQDLHQSFYTFQSAALIRFCCRLGKNRSTSEEDVIADPQQDLNQLQHRKLCTSQKTCLGPGKLHPH